MPTSATQNIVISVEARFEENQSSPSQLEFVFSYRVIIRNNSPETVQLLSRHWYIFDSSAEYNEVKGEGVIGEQPIILPGQQHEYQSYCTLKTDIGMMWGTYLMKQVKDNKLFEVKIPEFQLIAPNRLN